MDERVRLQVRIDDLLDALSSAYARADLAEERCAYAENELINCQEST